MSLRAKIETRFCEKDKNKERKRKTEKKRKSLAVLFAFR
jgi:hypothetical protein